MISSRRALLGSAFAATATATWPSSRAATATSATNATVNVADFGATGDGRTDDTQAVQAAIDAVRGGGPNGGSGGTVVVPAGTYSIGSLEVGWCVALVGTAGSYGVGTGEQPAGSVLVQRTGASAPMLRAQPGGTKHVLIERLCLDGTASAGRSVGIGGTWSDTMIRDCRIAGYRAWGIEITKGNLVTVRNCAVVGNGQRSGDDDGGVSLGCTEPVVETNWIANNVGTGLRLTDAPIDGRIIGNTIEGYTPNADDSFWGITVTFAQRLHIVANSVRGFNGGIRFHKGGSGSKLIGNHLGDNSRARPGATPNLLIDPVDVPLTSLLIIGNDFACEGTAVSTHIECREPQKSAPIRAVLVDDNDFSEHEEVQPAMGVMQWPDWSATVRDVHVLRNLGDHPAPTVVPTAPGLARRVWNTTRRPAVLVITTERTPVRAVDVGGLRVFESDPSVTGVVAPPWTRRVVTPTVPVDGFVLVSTALDEPTLVTTWLPV